MTEDKSPEPKNRISRRDFLKIGVGAAATATGAAAVLGKLPLPSNVEPTSRRASSIRIQDQEPIVATVDGDLLTVMNGQASVRIKDADLAGLIAEKLQEGED